MKKRNVSITVSIILSLCGLAFIGAYALMLSDRLRTLGGGAIIGGADTPTFLFIARYTPIHYAVIGIILLAMGILVLVRRKRGK